MSDIDTAAIRAKYTDPQIGSQKMVRVLCDALDAARAERDEVDEEASTYRDHTFRLSNYGEKHRARAEAAEARIAAVTDEYEAWNTEGLGTCPLLHRTNYPDAWVGIGVALYGEMR